jgi:hypothetical protein
MRQSALPQRDVRRRSAPSVSRSQKARIVAKARALEQEREAAKAGPTKAHAAAH